MVFSASSAEFLVPIRSWNGELQYLVGGWAKPLWKIWLRQLGWLEIPNISGKIKLMATIHHQPAYGTQPPFVDLKFPAKTLWTILSGAEHRASHNPKKSQMFPVKQKRTPMLIDSPIRRHCIFVLLLSLLLMYSHDIPSIWSFMCLWNISWYSKYMILYLPLKIHGCWHILLVDLPGQPFPTLANRLIHHHRPKKPAQPLRPFWRIYSANRHERRDHISCRGNWISQPPPT